jgi:hypothetical protein
MNVCRPTPLIALLLCLPAATALAETLTPKAFTLQGGDLTYVQRGAVYSAWNASDPQRALKPGMKVFFFGRAEGCEIGTSDGPVTNAGNVRFEQARELTGIPLSSDLKKRWTPSADTSSCQQAVRGQVADSFAHVNDGPGGGIGMFTFTGPDQNGRRPFFQQFDRSGQRGKGANPHIEGTFVAFRFDWQKGDAVRPWSGPGPVSERVALIRTVQGVPEVSFADGQESGGGKGAGGGKGSGGDRGAGHGKGSDGDRGSSSGKGSGEDRSASNGKGSGSDKGSGGDKGHGGSREPIQAKQQIVVALINPECMKSRTDKKSLCQFQYLFNTAVYRQNVRDWSQEHWFKKAGIFLDPGQGGLAVVHGPVRPSGETSHDERSELDLYVSRGAPTQHSQFSDKEFRVEVSATQLTNAMKVIAGQYLRRDAKKIGDAELASVFGPRWANPEDWMVLSVQLGQEVHNPMPAARASIGGNVKEVEVRALR